MHTIRAMEEVPADKVLRLTMLFHDMGKPAKKTTDAEGIDHFHGHAELSAKMAKEILQRLKFDNDTIGKVTKLVKNHDRKIIPHAKYVRRALCDLGEEIFLLLLEVKHADVMAQSTCRREEKLEELVRLREVYEEIKAADNCFSLKQLAVSGKDLIAAGITPGLRLGRHFRIFWTGYWRSRSSIRKKNCWILFQRAFFKYRLHKIGKGRCTASSYGGKKRERQSGYII